MLAVAARSRLVRRWARPVRTPATGCETTSPAAWCIGGFPVSACSTASASVTSPLRWRISQGTPCAFIAGRLGSSLRAASARTSSSAPAVIMASTGHRSGARPSRSGIRKTLRRGEIDIAGLFSSCQSSSDRPVASTTSSARVTRARSAGRSCAAAAGSSPQFRVQRGDALRWRAARARHREFRPGPAAPPQARGQCA